jgi:hypothetical protein
MRTDGRADMTKLIFAFHNFAKAPNNDDNNDDDYDDDDDDDDRRRRNFCSFAYH